MPIKLKRDKRLDVFQAYLVEGANFCGEFEIPLVGNTNVVPELMVPFSVALSKEFKPKHPERLFVHFLKTTISF